MSTVHLELVSDMTMEAFRPTSPQQENKTPQLHTGEILEEVEK